MNDRTFDDYDIIDNASDEDLGFDEDEADEEDNWDYENENLFSDEDAFCEHVVQSDRSSFEPVGIALMGVFSYEDVETDIERDIDIWANSPQVGRSAQAVLRFA